MASTARFGAAQSLRTCGPLASACFAGRYACSCAGAGRLPARRYLYLSAFVYGLTLTNSQILLAATPAIPALVLAAKGRRVLGRWRPILGCSAAFAAGLTPYLYVPIASMANPPMNWGYARTPAGFVHVISRGQYERVRPTSQAATFAKQVKMYVQVTGKEFGWPFVIVAAIPWLFLRRIPAPARACLLTSMVLYLCLTLLLIAVLNPIDYLEGRRTIKVFFLRRMSFWPCGLASG